MLHVHATQKREICRQELREAVFQVRHETQPGKQKISSKTKTLLNKTRVMYIHAGATIIRTIIIIRMRTRRRMF